MMRQLTIRGFEPELERKIRQLARQEGISLNQAALRLLRKGSGIGVAKAGHDVVGSSLDYLVGTWSDREAEEVMEAVADFEKVDEALWH